MLEEMIYFLINFLLRIKRKKRTNVSDQKFSRTFLIGKILEASICVAGICHWLLHTDVTDISNTISRLGVLGNFYVFLVLTRLKRGGDRSSLPLSSSF